jgi:hypothetical protein
MRAFQLQFMGSSSWRHTAILKSLRLPYLATCSWIRTSSAAISISERARNVRGGCWRDLGAPSMLSAQAIHIRCVRRLLGQAPGLLHQHHDQDAGAAADPGCCDHPPCRDHSVTPLFRRPVAGSTPGCAARFSLCYGKLIVCRLTDIVMCATSPNFPSLCSIQRDVPPDSGSATLDPSPASGAAPRPLAFRESAIARRRKQEARDLVNSACFAALSDKLVAIDLDLESGRCRLALHRRLRIEATR